MKLINEKPFRTHENDIKCVVENDTNLFSIEYSNDGNVLVAMHDLDESNIRYDDEFKMRMVISRIEHEDLFNAFQSLYNNLKEEHKRYEKSLGKETTVDRQVTIYSHDVEAEVANSLTITLGRNLLLLSFKSQKPKAGYRKEIFSSVYIPLTLNRTWSETGVFEEFYESLKTLIDENTKNKKPLTFTPKKKEEE